MLHKERTLLKKHYYRNKGKRYYFNIRKPIINDGSIKIFVKSNKQYIKENKFFFGNKHNISIDSYIKYMNIYNNNKHRKYKKYGLDI